MVRVVWGQWDAPCRLQANSMNATYMVGNQTNPWWKSRVWRLTIKYMLMKLLHWPGLQNLQTIWRRKLMGPSYTPKIFNTYEGFLSSLTKFLWKTTTQISEKQHFYKTRLDWFTNWLHNLTMDEGHIDDDDTVILLMQNKRFSATMDFYWKLSWFFTREDFISFNHNEIFNS